MKKTLKFVINFLIIVAMMVGLMVGVYGTTGTIILNKTDDTVYQNQVFTYNANMAKITSATYSDNTPVTLNNKNITIISNLPMISGTNTVDTSNTGIFTVTYSFTDNDPAKTIVSATYTLTILPRVQLTVDDLYAGATTISGTGTAGDNINISINGVAVATGIKVGNKGNWSTIVSAVSAGEIITVNVSDPTGLDPLIGTATTTVQSRVALSIDKTTVISTQVTGSGTPGDILEISLNGVVISTSPAKVNNKDKFTFVLPAGTVLNVGDIISATVTTPAGLLLTDPTAYVEVSVKNNITGAQLTIDNPLAGDTKLSGAGNSGDKLQISINGQVINTGITVKVGNNGNWNITPLPNGYVLAPNDKIDVNVIGSDPADPLSIATVTIPPAPIDKSALTLSQSSITLAYGATFGDTEARALISSALDKAGNDVTSSVIISGLPSTTSPGTYTVTYSLPNSTKTTNLSVTVQADKSALTLSQSSITLAYGSTFGDIEARALISSALDKAGNNVTSSVIISGLPSTTSPGNYTVTYSLPDGSKTATLSVTVQAAPIDKSALTLSQSTLTLPYGATFGDTEARTLILSALDKDGNNVIPNVIISGLPSTSTAGPYTVTYSLPDGSKTASLSVTVQAAPIDKSALTLSQSTLTLPYGATFGDTEARALILSALDKDGNNVIPNVTISGLPITTTPGTYIVIYTLPNSSKTATLSVTVQAAPADKSALTLSHSSITLAYGATFGDTEARALILSALDKDGNNVKPSVTISGLPSTSTAGSYTVTYSLPDGSKISTLSVTVQAANTTSVYVSSLPVVNTINDPFVYETGINATQLPSVNTTTQKVKKIKDAVIYAKDMTINKGSIFQIMKDVTSKDNGGKGADLTKKIRVSGIINTAKAGIYKMTYSVKGENGKTVVKTVYITVK